MASNGRRPQAVVVVLGDVGRSPRMANHALSLATQLDYEVHIVGYHDTNPHPDVLRNKNIRIVAVSPPPQLSQALPESITLLFKFTWTFFVLLYSLLFRTPLMLHLILLQNPPGLPTMFVCWIVARLKCAKWVIDWHNYTYSMLKHKWKMDSLALPRIFTREAEDLRNSEKELTEAARKRLNKEEREAAARTRRRPNKTEKKTKKSLRRRFVEWTYTYEGWMGRRADASLCVTRAMRDDLRDAWAVPAAVFYDRPPAYKFKEVTMEERHTLFTSLSEIEDGELFRGSVPDGDCEQWTRFTSLFPSGVFLRPDRPLLLVSSTSWTPDEDFGILLEALAKYDKVASLSPVIGVASASSPNTLVPIVCVVTGRGEQKEEYLERIRRMSLSRVQIVTPWLEAEDYPRLLAAADIGVCLHTSTSALDLPMKVVDMFGAGIPVLAKRYACLHELVAEGKNGRMFDTAHELSQLLQQLAAGFPTYSKDLQQLKDYVLREGLNSWENDWSTVVESILTPEIDEHLERTLAR